MLHQLLITIPGKAQKRERVRERERERDQKLGEICTACKIYM